MTPPRPSLDVVYRYCEAGGRKSRPRYFSKELALLSFLEAAERVRGAVRIIFLVDGEVSDVVAGAMSAAGIVRRGRWGSNRRSYWRQLSLAARSPADAVWLAEDDYLYGPRALQHLVDAVDAATDVEWFALSGPTPVERLELRTAQGSARLDRHERRLVPGSGGENVPWRQIESTTSTFGGRPAAFRRARWLLTICPLSGAAWDRTSCLALQGAVPYPWRHLLHDLLPASTPPRRRRLRVAWRLLSRVVVNMAAMTQSRRRAVLLAPLDPEVGHMDLPYESCPNRWDRLAADMLEGPDHPLRAAARRRLPAATD